MLPSWLSFNFVLSPQGLRVRWDRQGLLGCRDPQALLDPQDLRARMDKRGLWGHQVRMGAEPFVAADPLGSSGYDIEL